MKNILFSFIAIFCLSCSGQKSPHVQVMDKASFAKAIQSSDAQLIDVRTAEEFKEGSIDNAVNIDFYADNFLDQFNNYNKNEAIYIFCRSGGRSAKACNQLAEKGFTKIYDLEGGYLNWSDR